MQHTMYLLAASLWLQVSGCLAAGNPFSVSYRTLSLWTLSEGGGDTVSNQINQSHQGKLAGNVRWTEDACGKGLLFDGATGKVLISGPMESVTGAKQPFTLDALIKPTNSDVTQRIWYGGSLGLEVRSNGVVWFSVKDQTSGEFMELQGTEKVIDGQCHRITVERNVRDNKLTLYVDAQIDVSIDCPPTVRFTIPGSAIMGGVAQDPPNRKGEYYSGVIYGIHLSRSMAVSEPQSETVTAPENLQPIPVPRGTLPIANGGKSEYVIYHAPDAPASVRTAAMELQRVLNVSTFALLPIVNEPKTPMICLGDNAAAHQVGLSAVGLPLEGFRVATKGKNLYIVGRDHNESEEKWRPHPLYYYFGHCVSRGTLFGAYTFLEDAVGARWLMPGEWGEDVPDHSRGLFLKSMDVTGSPDILSRQLHSVQGRNDDVRQWFARNRLGGSIAPEASHAFDEHPGVDALKDHPEFAPMRADGTREPIYTGPKPGFYSSHKYCLTNSDLTQAFAASVTRKFDASPKKQSESISPSDGQGWCLCSACQALADRDTTGPFGDFDGRGYSYTPILLNFYNQVARTVASKHPDRLIGGYAYYEGLYPPLKPVKLEPNVFIEMAMNSAYGFKLYQPKRADEFARLLPAWAKLTSNLGWTDYSTWMRDAVGAPLPPGLSIMKLVFPALKKSKIQSVGYTGIEAWGYGAAANYLACKLMWDCDADVDKLYRDFLNRAYGPAAPMIDGIYRVSDAALQEYIRSKPYPDHEVWYETVAAVWQPHWTEIERLYTQALPAVETEAQRKRLEMFGDNLTMLHYNMRKAGMIENPSASPLYLSDEAYGEFIQEKVGSLSVVNLERWAENQKLYGKVQMALWGPENRKLTVPRLPAGTAAPKIDGDLSDAAWKAASVADVFRETGSRDPAKTQTTGRIAWDNSNLYISLECQEDDMDNIRQYCRDHDSARIFVNDVVEVFLDVTRDNPKDIWHIVVNPANTVWDGIYADSAPDLAISSATAVADKSWTVEMSVPFAGLKTQPPSTGTVYRCNLARVRQSTPAENSTWCSVEGSFLEPAAYGEWRFEE